MNLQLPAKQENVQPLRTLITPVQAQEQLAQLRALVQSYLEKDTDYGKMPGTDKDVLFKSGAEKLCEIYGFYADYAIHTSVEDWDRKPALFDYTIKCTVRSRNTEAIITTGIGSCNSYESKYRWRKAKKVCPGCNKDAIKPSKAEWGGGYYCDAKDGGCGASWKAKSTGKRAANEEDIAICKEIDKQPAGRVENPDIADTKNTILKMAKKRAFIDAIITATRSSGIFTQDVEDFLDGQMPQATVVNKLTPQDWFDLKANAIKSGIPESKFQEYIDKCKAQGHKPREVYDMTTQFIITEAAQHDTTEWNDNADAEYTDTDSRDDIE